MRLINKKTHLLVQIYAIIINCYISRMCTLSHLGDVTTYLREDFKNEVFLITEDEAIKCNGILLAARSTVIEEIIQNSESIKAIQFSDNLPCLFVCLDLIYGGSVYINEENYRSIFKFGKIFQVQEMIDAVLKWVAEELPLYIFWEVCFDLTTTRLVLTASTAAFQDAVKRYVSNNCNEFLQAALLVCRDSSEKNIKRMMELVTSTGDITSHRMLIFFADLVNTAPGDDTTPSSSASPSFCFTKHVDTIISCAVDYIEKHEDDIISWKCTERLLRKFSSVCNNIQDFRKIANIQSDMLRYRGLTVSSKDKLSWKLIRMLTSPSTSDDAMRYFTEHTGRELHPCITAEIVLKWWHVKEGVCSDNTVIETVFLKVHDIDSDWGNYVARDSRYSNMKATHESKRMVGTPCLGRPAVLRYFYYYCNEKIVSQLKQCIQAGDSTPLVLPVKNIRCSDNMRVNKDTVPAFRYNPAVVPPYGINNAHWYLVCKCNGYGITTFSLISFITDVQQEIMNYLKQCAYAWLYFVPLPDSDN